jgi:large subunit ribosomal protein L28
MPAFARGTSPGLSRKIMAQHCQFCEKTPVTGRRISHAHNVTSRKWHLNLKSVRAVVDGVTRRTRACTRCIRSGRVTKPTPRAKAS